MHLFILFLNSQASDVDKSSTLSYTILSGNEGNSFALDSKTGLLSSSNNYKVSAEPRVYTLDIEATDTLHTAVSKLILFTYNNSYLVEFETSANESEIQSQKQLFERYVHISFQLLFIKNFTPRPKS